MNKLNAGDAFPALSLQLIDGSTATLPASGEPGEYQVVLFYRGHF